MKSSSVSPMSKNIDIKQGLDVKNNLHDSGKAKFGKDFWYGKVKEKNCTCKPELHTSLHEVIEAEKTCPIHKEDSKCNCGKESLGVQEYCPTHNNPEDSKGECRCKEIGSGYKLLLDCPVHNSLESNGECMKLVGIRVWFKSCIDKYGFVPPIKYVTPEEYQYAKKFEDRGLKNMTDYPEGNKDNNILEAVKKDLCPKCGCHPICPCHVVQEHGGCESCGVCHYFDKKLTTKRS